ncbi:MAG TPA: flagellar basal body L-ring protein FlgH [Terriglobia bacterium]|nr:flagellar basal body L-ring protein FlgH [Terriglobia bacterium]
MKLSEWKSTTRCLIVLLPIFLLLIAPGGALAKKKKKENAAVLYQQSLNAYIRQAQKGVANTVPTVGSIYNPNGAFSKLPRDDKAYRLGDILTINIIEQTTAQSTGNVKSARTFSASSGISALFGELGPTNRLQSLFSPNSQNALAGQAQTGSSSLLTTALAATIVGVLPNDYLVIQATRAVMVDNQRQEVILRGIARPTDIGPDNAIPSTALADLSVEVVGKGIITDETRPPNRIIRAILRIIGF